MVDRLCAVLPVVDHCQESYKGSDHPLCLQPPRTTSEAPAPQQGVGYQLTKAVAISQPLCLRCACRHHHQVPQQLKEGEATGSALYDPHHQCPRDLSRLTSVSWGPTRLIRGMGRLGITRKCTGAWGATSRNTRHYEGEQGKPHTCGSAPLPPWGHRSCCPSYLVIFIENGGRDGAVDDLAEDGGLPSCLLAGRCCLLCLAHLPVPPAGRRHAPLGLSGIPGLQPVPTGTRTPRWGWVGGSCVQR